MPPRSGNDCALYCVPQAERSRVAHSVASACCTGQPQRAIGKAQAGARHIADGVRDKLDPSVRVGWLEPATSCALEGQCRVAPRTGWLFQGDVLEQTGAHSSERPKGTLPNSANSATIYRPPQAARFPVASYNVRRALHAVDLQCTCSQLALVGRSQRCALQRVVLCCQTQYCAAAPVLPLH